MKRALRKEVLEKEDDKSKTEEAPKLVTEITQQTLPHTSQETNNVTEEKFVVFDICPSCGEATLAHEEGCSKCYSCGHSEC